MHSPTTPPTAAAVLAALCRLERAGHQFAVNAAALHLATPTTVAVGVEARVRGGQLHFRDRTQPAAAGLVDAAHAAAELAAAVHRPGDEYLPLTADTATDRWVKVLPSGARRVAFGADVLFGVPATSLEGSVTDADLSEWLGAWRAGATAPVMLPGGALADGGDGQVVLRSGGARPTSGQTAGALTAGTPAPADVAGRAAAQLGAVSVTFAEVTAPPARGVRVFAATAILRHGWEARFPFTVAPGSVLVGEPAWKSDGRPAEDAAPVLPDGFLSVRSTADGQLARHAGSGLVVCLRRATLRGYTPTVTEGA